MPKFEQKYTSEEFLSALGKGFKTAGYIAKKCGCSRGTSISYLCDLERKGLAHKIPVDDGQSNVWKTSTCPEVVCADEKDFAQNWKLTCSQDNFVIELTLKGACALLEDLNELQYCSKGEAYSRLVVSLRNALEKGLDELKIH